MKIGCIYCAYGLVDDLIEKTLTPWINYQDNEDTVIVSATSCAFDGFPYQDNTKTLTLLKEYKKNNKIDSLLISAKAVQESEARNGPLSKLCGLGVDAVILVDADEEFTNEDIKGIFTFLKGEKQSDNLWYRILYKNLLFDGSVYTKGFDPARVYWVNKNYLQLSHFADDNYCYYNYMGESIECRKTPHKHIPEETCNPLHYTWINNQRSKDKIQYQIKHFGAGDSDSCSFVWNDAENKLEFNPNYYIKYNKTLPEVFNLRDTQ